MKRLKTKIGFLLLPRLHVAWYKIVDSIMKFAVDVQQNGKPMMTKIATVDMSKEKIIGDFDIVSLWAAVGDANPIERIGHLKAQNTAMKDLLKACQDKLTDDKDLSINIKLVLDTFE